MGDALNIESIFILYGQLQILIPYRCFFDSWNRRRSVRIPLLASDTGIK
jgi:hypothetical protein